MAKAPSQTSLPGDLYVGEELLDHGHHEGDEGEGEKEGSRAMPMNLASPSTACESVAMTVLTKKETRRRKQSPRDHGHGEEERAGGYSGGRCRRWVFGFYFPDSVHGILEFAEDAAGWVKEEHGDADGGGEGAGALVGRLDNGFDEVGICGVQSRRLCMLVVMSCWAC